MATNCIRGAARQAANPAHSQLSSPRSGSDGGSDDGDRDPLPSQRTTLPNSQLCLRDLLFRLASTMRVAQSPHLAGKVKRRGWELCFLKKTAKSKTKQKSSSNIQPSRCNSPARCTLSPEPAGHSPPALRPHLGARGGHRRALTWHLLLSVQVVAVFTWVFK